MKIAPVSYTHLDVYKRQALHRHDHEKNHPADLELRSGGILPDKHRAHDNAQDYHQRVQPVRIAGKACEQRPEPVSYTHLYHK